MTDNTTEGLARLDPRARRTRALLRDTLLALIVERQTYADITIKEIATRAELSRTTFYLHFKDVDDLLYETMRDLYMEIVEKSQRKDGKTDPTAPHDFQHVAQYADLYRVLLGEKGSPAFVARVRGFLAQMMKDHMVNGIADDQLADLPQDMIAYYLAGAHIGIVDWWLRQDMPNTPEEMARFMWLLCSCELGCLFTGTTSSEDTD